MAGEHKCSIRISEEIKQQFLRVGGVTHAVLQLIDDMQTILRIFDDHAEDLCAPISREKVGRTILSQEEIRRLAELRRWVPDE